MLRIVSDFPMLPERIEAHMLCSGLQPRAVQGMLDFDFICKRTTPSVAGIIYTFGGQFVSKMYVALERSWIARAVC